MSEKSVRGKTVRGIAIGIGVLVLLLLAAAALTWYLAEDLVDLWWFDALDYAAYFWFERLYQYLVFAVVAVIFCLAFYLNFRLASRFRGGRPPVATNASRKSYAGIVKAFQAGSLLFYGPLSLILCIPIAVPLFSNWEKFLFFLFGPAMGVTDPFFSQDISFYLFRFSIYTLLQNRLLLAAIVLLLGTGLIYLMKNRLAGEKAFHFTGGARWHLSLLAVLVIALVLWHFLLARYALVFDRSHEPMFTGPGYVQMKVMLPLIWATIGLTTAVAVLLMAVVHLKKGVKGLAVAVVLLAAVQVMYQTAWLNRLVQTYIVQPNESEKEKPYIAKNIEATLDAYNLNRVVVNDFPYQRFPVSNSVAQVKNTLRNIPVWDAETLDLVFKQLQELRTYYTFPQVSVGRYVVGGNYQQVFLAAREMEYENLPTGAKNWTNEHLTYTHGFGVVMTPASQNSGDSMTWFIDNIPPKSDYGLILGQPRIYYGLGKYPYAIAPNRAGEMDYPKGDSNVTADYTGQGGVLVSSLFRRLVFAYTQKDKNLLFSGSFSKESRILIRRNVQERIHHLTPFLTLDRTPYVAATAGGIFWIIDAYTTSSQYPAAAFHTEEGAVLNYLRNSVKVVVNAFSGKVDYYVYDPSDPIIRTYQRIYPGLFKDKAQMPADLQPHVRYPKDFFDIQMAIYAKYHQTDPQVFYQQEDLWTFAETRTNETTVALKPYYLTLELMTPGQLDFLLLLPMFPKGRDNLRSLAIVGCDGPNYGKIIIYNFPKGELVYGPAQIDALINQDPTIAQQFTLWDQAGSSLVKGKMIILPIENSVLFIQPVYLKSTSRVTIPELQRIIMSEGRVAVMETSLEKAYSVLRGRVAEELKGVEKRFPQVAPEPAPPEQGQAQEQAPAAVSPAPVKDEKTKP